MRRSAMVFALLAIAGCTKKEEKPAPSPAPSANAALRTAPEVFATVDRITQVAADARSLYLTSDDTADGSVATGFRRLPWAGGEMSTLNPPLPPVQFLEPRADAVYLLFKSVPGKQHAQLERMEVTGAKANASTVIVDTYVDGDTWMASDDTYFYYFGGTRTKHTAHTLSRVPIAGGAEKILARLPDGATATSLVRQGMHLYWATRTNDTGAIMSFELGEDAGAAKQVAAVDASVAHIASDATHLYLTTKPLDGTDNEGAVLRVALADGKVDSWVEKQNRPSAIAVDATAVYWGTENGLFKRVKTSRMIETLARDESVAETMVLDDRNVYWATTGRLMRVPKD